VRIRSFVCVLTLTLLMPLAMSAGIIATVSTDVDLLTKTWTYTVSNLSAPADDAIIFELQVSNIVVPYTVTSPLGWGSDWVPGSPTITWFVTDGSEILSGASLSGFQIIADDVAGSVLGTAITSFDVRGSLATDTASVYVPGMAEASVPEPSTIWLSFPIVLFGLYRMRKS
jgi:hypothetical protein